MYVFGYGSLIWNPGFTFERQVAGCVKGFSRRFWQGSEEHRGVPGKPGRVAVAIPADNPEEEVWGVAFEIAEANLPKAMAYLSVREKGYDLVMTAFYPHGSSGNTGDADHDASFDVGIFVALTTDASFVGPAPIPEIARTIYFSKGKSGTNLEYFKKLVQALERLLPAHVLTTDSHLAELGTEIKHLEELHAVSTDAFLASRAEG